MPEDGGDKLAPFEGALVGAEVLCVVAGAFMYYLDHRSHLQQFINDNLST
jgi:hypothetical protein